MLLHSIFRGTFGWLKGPLMAFIMASIVLALVRSPPGRLSPVRVARRRRAP